MPSGLAGPVLVHTPLPYQPRDPPRPPPETGGVLHFLCHVGPPPPPASGRRFTYTAGTPSSAELAWWNSRGRFRSSAYARGVLEELESFWAGVSTPGTGGTVAQDIFSQQVAVHLQDIRQMLQFVEEHGGTVYV